MEKLTRSDLHSLESYAQQREDIRRQVIAHKKNRRISLGPNAVLIFEDRMTIQYQIQEMLRIEKVFEAKGIEEELEAYNPLIPDGDNFKATFMIEFPNVEERQVALVKLRGIERQIQLLVEDFDPLYAIADEDMERENEEKTAAVHFMRFQLPADVKSALQGGAIFGFACDHPEYLHSVYPVSEPVRLSLLGDLQ